MRQERERVSHVVIASYLIRASNEHAAKWDAAEVGVQDAELNADRMDELNTHVQELAHALTVDGEHPPASALVQIGAVVFNWLRQYDRTALDAELLYGEPSDGTG